MANDDVNKDVWMDDDGDGDEVDEGQKMRGKNPRLLAAVPCEDASVSASMGDNRVSLQRVFYDLYAGAFPAGFDRLNVATVWSGGEGEHTISARLSGPDGETLAEAGMEMICQPEPATMVNLIHFSSNDGLTLVLPSAGRYTVAILVDGAPVSTFPLFVIGLGINESDEEEGENGEETTD